MLPAVAELRSGFGPVRQVEAGPLSVGYVERGPACGRTVVLLHGWPYDIHSYAEVAPILASAGYRVLVPYLRGFGTTRFLSRDTLRNAQQSAIAQDVINLLDALSVERAIVAGFDWGARTAYIVAALWPERCRALVSGSRYLVTHLKANTLRPAAEDDWLWWYERYFASDDGCMAYETNRNALARLIWRSCSPNWQFDEETFARTAVSFSNPDHAAIVTHNYRWRLNLAPGEARFDSLEGKLTRVAIRAPTITLGTAADAPTNRADVPWYRKWFRGPYSHRVLSGVGHNVPQEAPRAFADAVVDVDAR